MEKGSGEKCTTKEKILGMTSKLEFMNILHFSSIEVNIGKFTYRKEKTSF